MRRMFASLSAVGLVVVLLFAACTSDSDSAAFGTPEWYWQAAVDTFKSADYTKTAEHLGKIVGKENPWQQRAIVWRAVVLGGLGLGYLELANALAEGSEEAESLAPEFQIPLQQYRRYARGYAISLTESIASLHKSIQDAQTVPFDFPFPGGNPNPSPILGTVRGGQAPREAQLAEVESETVGRGILLQAAKLAGADEDVNRARSMFATTPVEVPRTTFLWELGESIFDLSELFDKKNLNEPEVRKVMFKVALDCIEPALAAEDEELKKQAEELKEEIEKQQKDLPA